MTGALADGALADGVPLRHSNSLRRRQGGLMVLHFNMWVGVRALQCLLLLHPARMGMRRMSRTSSSVRAVGVKKDPKMTGRVSASRGVIKGSSSITLDAGSSQRRLVGAARLCV